jgi:hypothetical protein
VTQPDVQRQVSAARASTAYEPSSPPSDAVIFIDSSTGEEGSSYPSNLAAEPPLACRDGTFSH